MSKVFHNEQKNEQTSNKKWVVERRNIQVSDEIDKKWVVTDGLSKDDVIVGKGIQGIRRDGQVINPTPLEDNQKYKKNNIKRIQYGRQ